MDKNTFQRIERLFDEVVELPEDERRRRLDETCVDSPELREQVEALLAAADRSVSQAPDVVRAAASELEAEDPLIGSTVGPFLIESLLGSGGFGTVYVARQEEPVERKVALKVIRPGMSSGEVLARFESERQTLARMDHPSIARVFDVGETQDGRPYFTMELVDGKPIQRFCDENRFSVRQRLSLFVAVTRAVQHAHQKGVMHRDLKPSNILVTDQDGEPRPVVIDFGIAKAIEPLEDSGHLTATMQLVGTPEYMSPEQAELGTRDVDTRSDVYSLGTVLYELLTGATPFGSAELRRRGVQEILRVLREEDPPRPSVRLEQTEEAGRLSAERRDTQPVSLSRALRGDLDWIVMKALEKDPARRYDSVGAMGDDVQRHLEDEPVSAGPPGHRYRLAKFVRRNKAAVISTLLIFTALAVGLTAAMFSLERARKAEAEQRIEAETSQQVSDFLVQLFSTPLPNRPGDGSVTARELLDRGAAQIREDLEEQPDVRARLMTVIGAVYTAIDQHDEALSLIEEGLELRRQIYPEDHLAVSDSLSEMGGALYARGDMKGAGENYGAALEMRLRLLTPDHPKVADGYQGIATVHRYLNELDQAEAALREALRILESQPQRQDGTILAIRARLADALAGQQGKLESAEEMYRQLLDDCAAYYGEEHQCSADTASSLAGILRRQEKYAEAEPLYEMAARLRKAINGPDSSLYAQAINNFATFLSAVDRNEEAMEYSRQAVATYERAVGKDHPSTAFSLVTLSGLLRNADKFDECVQTARRAQEILAAAHGADFWPGRLAQSRKGQCMVAQGRRDLGIQQLEEAYAGLLETLGEKHRHTRSTAERLERAKRGG